MNSTAGAGQFHPLLTLPCRCSRNQNLAALLAMLLQILPRFRVSVSAHPLFSSSGGVEGPRWRIYLLHLASSFFLVSIQSLVFAPHFSLFSYVF